MVFEIENLIAGLKGDWSGLSYGHLWFLYYLLAMYLMALALAAFAPKWLEKISDLFLKSRLQIMGLIPVLAVASVFGREKALFGQNPETVTEFHLEFFIFNMVFFVIGWRLFNKNRLLSKLPEKGFVVFSLMGAIILLLIVVALVGEAEFEFETGLLFWLINLLTATVTLLASLGLIGLSQRLIRQRSSVVSFAVETSYPIYYFHIPIMLPIVFYLYENDWSAIATVSMPTLVGLLGPLAVYYAFIKYTPLNWMFNGYRQSWFHLSKLLRLTGRQHSNHQ